jgi:2-dehydropantoate 2-reductase
MQIVIYGAGAVGSAIGAALSLVGHHVTFIARGEHLKALKAHGLTYITAKGAQTIKATFTDDAATIAEPDYLFLTTKAYDLPGIARRVNQIAGKKALIIPVQNGVPWWHFYKLKGPMENTRIESLDPEGLLEKYIDSSRVIGGVIYMAGSVTEPGITKNLMRPRFVVGEPDGTPSPRLKTLAALLAEAGFKEPLAENIRSEIWLKLCWNIAFNPLSVLTGATSRKIAEDEGTQVIAGKMMEQAKAITDKLGIPLALDVKERLSVGIQAGDHKPSMRYDYERGKRMETDAIIGAAVEIAARLGAITPTINTIYALLRQKEEVAYQG